MTRKTAVQTSDHIISGKDFVSISTYLQDIKAACEGYKIYESAPRWLFKHYLTGLIEAVIKVQVAIPTETT